MNERRIILKQLASVLCVGALPALALADERQSSGSPQRPLPPAPAGAPHVLVVGGGMGGATLSKYLRMWSGGEIAVSLVDRDAAYTTCMLSSLVLTGQRTLSAGTVSRAVLSSGYGVKLVTGAVTGIDAANHQVTLADGTTLRGDRLVLAPGLEFDRLPGLESNAAFDANPHAWVAGPQTTALAAQLRAMRAGGTFVLTIPPVPYRCPPGPYERASLVADWLKRNKPGNKVIVLDANPAIVAERASFTRAFTVTHAGVIDYVPNAVVQSIDAPSKTVHTTLGSFRADVLNPIPPQRAPKLLADAGLVNFAGRWAGVNVLNYESTVAVASGVHVIGDACGTTQPKSGHIANQEAKVCADAIIRALRGSPPDQGPMTSSACFSTITMSTASWLHASFVYDPGTKTMQIVPASAAEAASADGDNFKDMLKWFDGIMKDSFA